MISKKFIVVRADGNIRIVGSQRAPRLRMDEVAVPLNITIPDAWGEIDVTQAITIDMPPPPKLSRAEKAKEAK